MFSLDYNVYIIYTMLYFTIYDLWYMLVRGIYHTLLFTVCGVYTNFQCRKPTDSNIKMAVGGGISGIVRTHCGGSTVNNYILFVR